MAQTILISPGVFTREIDGTFLPAATVGAGACIVGPRNEGPAMVPVNVKDLDEDFALFGPPSADGTDYAAYASRTYLKQSAAPLTVIRTLGIEASNCVPGYTVGGLYAIGASGSNVIALIHSSGAVSLAGTMTSSVDNIAISVAGWQDVTASLNRNASNYISKVLNTDPTQYSTKKHYVFAVYDYAAKTPLSNNAYYCAQVVPTGSSNVYTDGYITASSAMVKSQPFDTTEYNLFGFGCIYAGDSSNTKVKVTITNIKKSINSAVSDYGSFTVLVRAFGDTDRNPQVLETFTNLTLDPNDRNYVLRRIGDRYVVWNSVNSKFDVYGEYPNKSRYIYVTPSSDLAANAVPASALPWGFAGLKKYSTNAVSTKGSFPDLPYTARMTYKGEFTTKVCWGVEVVANGSGSLNYGVPDRLKHLSKTALAASGTTDPSFSLKWVSASVGSMSGYNPSSRLSDSNISTLSTSISYNTGSTNPASSGSSGYTGYLSVDNIENTSIAKFTMVLADGFDGVNIHLSDPFASELMTSTTAYQTVAYRQAIDMIANPELVEITTLALPGVNASKVTDYALEKIEDRGDAFYVIDVSGSTVSDVVSDVSNRQLDSNYGAVYYPHVKMYDEVNDKFVFVPPSVVMPAVFASVDKNGYPWYAPAGTNRGGLNRFGVVEAKDKLTAAERDTLYSNRINPLASLSQQGVVVWGQKTLQLQSSALDRINVRRMLLAVRKYIAKIGNEIVFEPNVPKTWEKFVNKVQPYLERVRENSGIDDFKLIMDSRTNTQDIIDRNILYGKLAIKPTRTAEYVLLDFFVTNNLAGFTE